MAAYKDKKPGTWYVQFRYTDWKGERQQKLKRGFTTRREALEWERTFLVEKRSDINMTYESFLKLYEQDVRPGMRETTWRTKESIIRSKILPYLGKLKLCEITPKHIKDWQNEIRKMKDRRGRPFSENYMRTLHIALSSTFNHAVQFYNLPSNPARKAGMMGAEEKEMLFWTHEEYKQFIEEVMDKPMSFYAFEMLYWCGIREGELLALTPGDFDFKRGTVSITKSYQRLNGRDLITPPKTKRSNRVVQMPAALADEMKDYIAMFYGIGPDDRMFPFTKDYLEKEMARGSKAAGVKKIRIHDLRHH